MLANALVTARLAVTQSSRPAMIPSAATKPATQPPSAQAVSTRPVVATRAAAAGTPTSAAAIRPVSRVRREQRKQGEARRVEGLVDAEEDQRKQQPADHQQRTAEGGGDAGHLPVVHQTGQGEQHEAGRGEPSPDQDAADEDRDPPALATEAVGHHP